MGEYSVGRPELREEDIPLLQGRGRYVDDLRVMNLAHGYVLRSPYAHARIKGIKRDAAQNAPGVQCVLIGTDPEVAGLALQAPRMPRKKRDGSPMFVCPQPHLAKDTVRYVGDPVAFVVADTVAQAKDAAELIEVDYDPLPAVTDTAAAVEPGAPAVWPECPDNQAYLHTEGDKAKVDAAFAQAAHVVRHRLVINRITANSMEPRGALSEYDTFQDRFIMRLTLQSPHGARAAVAGVFKMPANKFQIIADNVGGGFGMKGGLYPEYILTAVAARKIGRPVKWISERSEAHLSDEQARDNVTDAELALDKDGKFLALRTRTLGALGAYNNTDRNSAPTISNLGSLAGTYTTPAIYCEVIGVLTNTMLTAHYRGAGRPEASYVIETMVDLAARKLGMSATEIRRINTIPKIEAPYKTGLTFTYDSGDFLKNLADCTKIADIDGFEARRAESKKRGKLRGLAVTNTIEATAGGLLEAAEIRFDNSGAITLMTGTHDHGQGHGTTFKQVLCEKLGVDSNMIRYAYGDTDKVVAGTGTFGSRSAAAASSAITIAAGKIIEKGKKIAAHMMEAAESDIVFEKGKFTVVGTDRAVSLPDVARATFLPGRVPRGMEAGLYETGTASVPPTFPNGCHVVEVEIDEDTGHVDIVRYHVVDDVGRMINPLLVHGQVHGGIAQGAGQALLEDMRYDAESGQLLTGSFMDYGMPRADDLPSIKVASNEVPAKSNPLGVKGAGEAGTVGALSAVMNAINDALALEGADYVQMPATPEKVWRALEQARGGRRAAE
jgi:carbon-monoxide dehydrogenase large subunit